MRQGGQWLVEGTVVPREKLHKGTHSTIHISAVRSLGFLPVLEGAPKMPHPHRELPSSPRQSEDLVLSWSVL